MVRGHLFYNRRAASVPVSEYRLSADTPVSSKAYLISNHANQDNDAMSAKSRRNDANFLHDVSNKLATPHSGHLGYPYVGDSTYVASRYPVAAIYPYSYPTYPYVAAQSNHYYPSDYRRGTWYAPPVSDYEVDSYLSGGPGRYYGRHTRAGSVPPVLPSSGVHVPRWHSSSSYARGVSAPRWTAPAVQYSGGSGDVLIGLAHTAQYGDINIGLPYSKRHLIQDNNHYKGGNNYKSYYYPSFANRYSVAPNYYPSSVSSSPAYRRASIAVPYRNIYDSYYAGLQQAEPTISASRNSVAALRGQAQTVQRQLQGTPSFQFFDNTAPAGISTSTFTSTRPVRAASIAPTISIAGTPSFQFYDSVAPAGVTISRPRAASSVPTFRAAGSSSSSSSVPAASSAYRGGGSSVSGGTSTSGAAPVSGGYGKYTKPPISETRRKCRDLLCKSKKNPHYFD